MKKKIKIREYHISHTGEEMQGKLCLAFLTDIHNCLSQKEQELLFSALEQVHPDFVLVGGDLLVGKKGASIENACEFMRRLSEVYPVVYAYGNHEQRVTAYPERYGDMGRIFEEKMSKTRAVRLVNAAASCRIPASSGEIPVTVYGLQPEYRFYQKGIKPKGMEEELDHRFGKREKGRYHILLAHNPRYLEEYLSWGADLTLSGHYHGGMMLIGRHRGVISPDYRILSKECCGLYRRGGAHMIVSAGLGEHTIPFRIHNPRELTVIRVTFS